MFIECLDELIPDVVFDVVWFDLLFSKCRVGLKAALDIMFIPTGYKEVDGWWKPMEKAEDAFPVLTFIQGVNNNCKVFAT